MGLSFKGLLLEGVDQFWQHYMDELFARSGMSRKDFEQYFADKEEELTARFDQIFISTYQKGYTHRSSFYQQGIIDFQKAMGRRYRRTFRLYFSYLSTCHFIVKNTFTQLTETNHSSTETITLSLFAHLLRLTDQIGIQLLSGYSDGAMLLWRSFYEYAVVLKLLAEQQNDDLSIRFMDHSSLHSRQLMESYQQRLETEGFDPIDVATSKALAQEKDRLERQYGKAFLKDYGWAAEVVPGGRPTFYELEKFVRMTRYRPFYKWASGLAHGTFAPFRPHTEDGKIMAGRIHEPDVAEQDLIDPMQVTLAVLQEAIDPFLRLLADESEADLTIRIFDALYDQLRRHFEKVPTKEEEDTGKSPKRQRRRKK